MKTKLLVFFLVSNLGVLWAQNGPDDFSRDIDQLSTLISEKHVSPFWSTTKEDFTAVVQDSKNAVSKEDISVYSRYAELLKIVASIEDGHSGVKSSSRYELFGYLPFSVRWFGDDIYVVRTSELYEEILGSRIEKVDGVGIKKVLAKLRLVVPHTNNSRFKKFSGSYLHLPGLLFGLGLTRDPGKVTLTLSKNGKRFERTILNLTPEAEETTKFVSYSASVSDQPLHLQNRDSNYWFNYDPTKKLLYFQFNRIANMDSEGSSAFNKRMWKLVDSVEVDRFVLDLRYNGGGSFPLSLKFVQGIIDRPEINKRGKLFVISGFDTFSAAIQMLSQLEMRSQAIIIGEPAGGPTGHPGDAKSYTLERTGIGINLSSLYHPSLFVDDRSSEVTLDKEVIETWNDRVTGRDPVMDFVSSYPKKTKSPAMTANFEQYVGTYEYSSTRNLRLFNSDGQLWLRISGGFVTPLYIVGEKTFESEIVGLNIGLRKEKIAISFPGGSNVLLNRRKNGNLSALDHLYNGDIEKAKVIFERIKLKNPDNIELKDHQMSFLASIVFFELSSKRDQNASAIAKSILNLGIELNDGDAPFCKFSLRFY